MLSLNCSPISKEAISREISKLWFFSDIFAGIFSTFYLHLVQLVKKIQQLLAIWNFYHKWTSNNRLIWWRNYLGENGREKNRISLSCIAHNMVYILHSTKDQFCTWNQKIFDGVSVILKIIKDFHHFSGSLTIQFSSTFFLKHVLKSVIFLVASTKSNSKLTEIFLYWFQSLFQGALNWF